MSKKYVKPAWYRHPVSIAGGAVSLLLIGIAIGHSGSGQAPTADAPNSSPAVSTASLAKPLGQTGAKLTIIEYADYQCPYCSKFNEEEMPQLKQDFIDTGKVKFEFRNAALLGNESVSSAAAAYCANDQGKFWQYHDALYAVTAVKNGDESHPQLDKGIFSNDNLKQIAQSVGLNQSQFDQCLDSNKYQGQVSSEAVNATAAGVQGTPMFVIGNQKFSGLQPYDIVKSLIESQLQ